MRMLRNLVPLLLVLAPSGLSAQYSLEDPLLADRPGFVFITTTVGRGTVQAELGLPTVTLYEFDDSVGGASELRSTSFAALLRIGVTDDLELRLGGPLYTETRAEFGRFSTSDSGYGDLEVGAKWRVVDAEGGRPAFALIPSVILPTGQDGFTADDPIYQLNAVLEWTLADGWGLGALAGYLNGPDGSDGDDRYGQEIFALTLGRALPAERWSAYGEAAYVATDLDGAGDSAFVGAGLKYLASNDVQVDLFVDRGLNDDSPDWLAGLGLSVRF